MLLKGANTLYLYAPANEQGRLRPLFELLVGVVIARAEERAARQPDGLLVPRLLLDLDEAGDCAVLAKLPELATTARGQGIQLLPRLARRGTARLPRQTLPVPAAIRAAALANFAYLAGQGLDLEHATEAAGHATEAAEHAVSLALEAGATRMASSARVILALSCEDPLPWLRP
jgi:hypothetical protein